MLARWTRGVLARGVAAAVRLRRRRPGAPRRRVGALPLLLRPVPPARRPRPDGLPVRPAPRLRRRPHRGDRQHHPQAPRRGQAAGRRRVLLLARALDDRVLAGGWPSRWRARTVNSEIPAFQEYGGYIGASVSGTFLWIIGILNLIVLVDILRIFREMRGRDVRPRAAREPPARARADEPLLRPVLPPDRPQLADVPARAALRPRVRHGHRGRAPGAGRGRRHALRFRSSRSWRCRSCSRPA